MPEQYYEFERGHFDGVITSYREMLVREGMAPASSSSNAELINVLQRCYSLLPPPPASDGSTTASEMSASRGADPPSHLIMHVLHLSGAEGRILPHVDNLEAFGRTIVSEFPRHIGNSKKTRLTAAGYPDRNLSRQRANYALQADERHSRQSTI